MNAQIRAPICTGLYVIRRKKTAGWFEKMVEALLQMAYEYRGRLARGRRVMRRDLGRGWYVSSYTHTYAAYKQTSFNLGREVALTGPRLGGEASLQFKYRWTRDGGFWFGFRPHVEIRRNEAKLRAFGEELLQAKLSARCDKCGREEWGEPGMRLPRDWKRVSAFMTICQKCSETYTLSELFKPYEENAA